MVGPSLETHQYSESGPRYNCPAGLQERGPLRPGNPARESPRGGSGTAFAGRRPARDRPARRWPGREGLLGPPGPLLSQDNVSGDTAAAVVHPHDTTGSPTPRPLPSQGAWLSYQRRPRGRGSGEKSATFRSHCGMTAMQYGLAGTRGAPEGGDLTVTATRS